MLMFGIFAVRMETTYSCATDENWDVLKYETMANLIMEEGISASNLSLDYALYLSFNTLSCQRRC